MPLCGYQKIIIVSTAKRLIPTARSPTITASSISICKKNTQFVRLRVVNLEYISWRGLAPRKARHAPTTVTPSREASASTRHSGGSPMPEGWASPRMPLQMIRIVSCHVRYRFLLDNWFIRWRSASQGAKSEQGPHRDARGWPPRHLRFSLLVCDSTRPCLTLVDPSSWCRPGVACPPHWFACSRQGTCQKDPC